jgi:hypothetical protein
MLQLLSVVKVACMLVVLPPAPEYQHVHPQYVTAEIGGGPAELTVAEPNNTANPRVPTTKPLTIALMTLLLLNRSSVAADHHL